MIVDIPGEAPYDVRIGSGVLARLGSHLRAMSAFENVERVLVVTDEEVARLYRADAKDSLAQAGFRRERHSGPRRRERSTVPST